MANALKPDETDNLKQNMMNTTDNKKRNSARLQIIALVAVFVLPWVAAFLWTPPGRVNNGELIEPVVVVPEMLLQNAEQKDIEFSSLQHHWLLLTTTGGQCDERCEKTLYVMRQVRLSLGKHAPRIQSILLTSSPLSSDDLSRYREADPNLVILTPHSSDSEAAGVLFDAQKEQPTAANGILVIDPNGNLMMRYAAGFEPKLIRKDLSRLLKASRIG